jgi:hypothetical protein
MTFSFRIPDFVYMTPPSWIYIFASCGRMLPRYFLYPASLFRHPDIIVALSYTYSTVL